MTFEELDRRARAFAVQLTEAGAKEDRVLLLLPSGPEYIVAFFACLYAGAVAIPGFPIHFGGERRGERWLRSVMTEAEPTLAVVALERLDSFKRRVTSMSRLSSLRCLSVSKGDLNLAEQWRMPRLAGDRVAFLQYTSGSTSDPRGVIISHSNLIHNQRCIQAACHSNQESTVVSWLPLHHDMGLIGTVLHPAFVGAQFVFMSPTTFLQNPASWLRAISRFGGQIASAPNFAYELCCRRVTEEEKVDLDLTRWRVAINGAEPVRFDTMERFAKAFAGCGFHLKCFMPSYGLAESTLMVTGARDLDRLLIKRFSARALEESVVRVVEGNETVRALVGCGEALLGQQIRVVDPVTRSVCLPEKVGEIWVSGPSVGQGYWNRPDDTASAFQAQLAINGEGPFLRTGDLGFVSDGQLFVTGRLKDLLIIRGRNLYPQDIELTVQSCHPMLRQGCGAAFTVDSNEQESLVVVNEVDRHSDELGEQIISSIRQAVALEHGVQIDRVILVKSGTVPRTTSGKTRRRACRQMFEEGALKTVASSVLISESSEVIAQPLRLSCEDLLQTNPELRYELIESYLRAQVAILLKIRPDDVTPDLPLVALGVDSLVAIQLRGVIDAALSLELETWELLQGMTLADLAMTALERFTLQVEPIQKNEPSRAKYPLSYGQRSLWVLYKLAPQSSAYNLAGALKVKTDLNVTALQFAFQKLLDQHEMLRAKFVTENGEPMYILQDTADLRLDNHFEYRDLLESTASLSELLQEEAQKPFSLEQEPPLRLLVLRLPTKEHCVALICHHIIVDMTSIGVLLHDLVSLYSTETTGRPASLTALRGSYADFVEWQSRRIEGEKGKELLEYWTHTLAGELPVLDLPTDRPHSLLQPYGGASLLVRLGEEVCRSVRAVARQANATPFMVLLAAFHILLHRLSGQEEVLVGCPTNGRSKADFANVVGYFVNPIVFRSYYDGRDTFAEYLEQVRCSALEGFKHQDYPFLLLVEALHPQRGDISPVFQTMFVWQGLADKLGGVALGAGEIEIQAGDVLFESVPVQHTSAQFDLTLIMSWSEAELLASWKYNTDLFSEATVKQISAQYSLLLDSIVRNPKKRLAELSLLSDTERQTMVEEWSQPLPLIGDRCVHELIEDQAARQPHSPALTLGEKTMTYAELNARANQFAHHLRDIGVRNDDLVGLCVPRSIEMIAALLGIWKAGAGYLPFDARDPKGRLSAVLQQSEIQVLVTSEQLLDLLPDQLPRLVLLDLDMDLIANESQENLNLQIPQRNLAYSIYTSGSTGGPKGTMVEHRSVINLLVGLQEAIYESYGDRRLTVGLNAPLAFDSSVKQLLALAMGHTLCVIPEDIRRNAQDLFAHMKATGLDVLDCTPTQLQLLIQAGFSSMPNGVTLLIGGEPISEETWTLLANSHSVISYNLYGPTECTVDSVLSRICSTTQPVIGRPLCSTRVYLLDDQLQPVPVGTPGEIFIGGPSVGRGYRGRPDLTAERFIPDPFATGGGDRMYQTGDRARRLQDGSLQFIGRVDRQVKVRGFRIELDEVEAALRECPEVEDAVVVARAEPNRTKQLVGYVVTSNTCVTNSFRRLLAQKLPNYMVPATVISVPAIPTNANGKRDYRALPDPEPAMLDRGGDYVAPKSATEQYLADLWSDTLRVHPIGVEDNFFALGGDSLQATKLISQVQDHYPTDVPLLALFFQEPTIAALAQFLSFNPGDPAQSPST